MNDQNNIELEIKEKSTYTMLVASHSSIIIHSFSSLAKVLRIAALCLRFKNNALRKGVKRIGPLSPQELSKANTALVKMEQALHFSTELSDLKMGNSVALKSKLLHLNPFLDEDNIILY